MTRIVVDAGPPEVDLDDAALDPEARRLIWLVRSYERVTQQVWSDPQIETEARIRLLVALLKVARQSELPDLACRAVERVSFEHVGHHSDPWERAEIETAIARDVEQKVVA